MSDLPTDQPHHPAPAAPAASALPLQTRLLARLRTRPHTRLAALGIVGAVMIVLPLAQVLRYQNAELQALVAERAGLDPVARAVEVQRNLITHRDLASQVLRGNGLLEPERQRQQDVVDGCVGGLGQALAGTPWQPAIREGNALRDDWAVLAGQVATRSVSAPESEQAHGLLGEQTLQVIDLVADLASPRASAYPQDRAAASSAALLAAARSVPLLVWQIDALAAPPVARDAAARQRDLASTEANLARTLGALDAALEGAGGPLAASADERRALANASAVAGATAERLIGQLRAGARTAGQPLPANQAAAAAALQAQFKLFTLAREAAGHVLAKRETRAHQRRSTLLWAMAALTLLALALGAHLLHGLRWIEGLLAQRRTDAAHADAAAAAAAGGPAPSASGVLAGRLLDRLRSRGAGHSAPAQDGRDGHRGQCAHDAHDGAAQPTQPPSR